MTTGLRIIFDPWEVEEACEILAAWEGCAHELPAWLRDQWMALMADPAPFIRVELLGEVASVALTPELRALVGNLRAREAR